MAELPLMYKTNYKSKDILIVVHDQLDHLMNCIESIYQNTSNYRLFIYDNGSDLNVVNTVLDWHDEHDRLVEYKRSLTNDGFIKPNNWLAKRSNSNYKILLNSDTIVKPGWDLAMINYLEENPNTKQVGYAGSKLDHNGMGGEPAFGNEPDYICGWCFCIHRNTYKEFGLFDEENLEFAYGEDSDFSLRLKEKNHQIYALHLDLVEHIGNQTIKQVHSELGNYVKETFERNHEYIRKRWIIKGS